MPVDATGKYQMNPAGMKTAAPTAPPEADETITIDPASMSMTVDGQTQTFPDAKALCAALETELNPATDSDATGQDMPGNM